MAEVRSEATCTGRKSNVPRCPKSKIPNHCHHGNQQMHLLRCHSTQNATMSSGSAVILPPICTQPLPHLGQRLAKSFEALLWSIYHVHPMSIMLACSNTNITANITAPNSGTDKISVFHGPLSALSMAPSPGTGEGLPNPAAMDCPLSPNMPHWMASN